MCRKEEENGYWVIRSVDCNTDNKTSHIFHVLLHFLAKIFFLEIAFKDADDKSMKRALTSQGFMEFASYLCLCFCQ